MRGYLGLGSNLGDPVAELRAAASELEGRGVSIPRRSSLYHTEPVGVPEDAREAWFINAVAEVDMEGDPFDLFQVCVQVEELHGRRRGARNAPRTLDLDLLLVEDMVVSTEILTLPHPRLHQRRFVLEPMVEIAPLVVHPIFDKSMRELLESCTDPSRVVRLEEAFAG